MSILGYISLHVPWIFSYLFLSLIPYISNFSSCLKEGHVFFKSLGITKSIRNFLLPCDLVLAVKIVSYPFCYIPLFFFFIIFWWCLGRGLQSCFRTLSHQIFSLFCTGHVSLCVETRPSPPFLLLGWVREACMSDSEFLYVMGFSVRLFRIYFLSVYLNQCLPSWLPLTLPPVPAILLTCFLGWGWGRRHVCIQSPLTAICLLCWIRPRTCHDLSLPLDFTL